MRSRDPRSWRRRRWQPRAGAGSFSRGVGPRQSVRPSAPSVVFRSAAGGAGMAERGLEPSPAAVAALPPEVRAQLAELELELSEGRRGARVAGSRSRGSPAMRGGWPGAARSGRRGRAAGTPAVSAPPPPLACDVFPVVSLFSLTGVWAGIGERSARPGLLPRSPAPTPRQSCALRLVPGRPGGRGWPPGGRLTPFSSPLPS